MMQPIQSQKLLCQQYLKTRNMAQAKLLLRDRGIFDAKIPPLPHPESIIFAVKNYLHLMRHLNQFPRDRMTRYRVPRIIQHVERVFRYETRKGRTKLIFDVNRAEVLYNALMNDCERAIKKHIEDLSQ